MIVSTAEAAAHCRADAEDDVAPYLAAAIDQAVQFLNRQVYEDAPALAAAIIAVPTELGAAQEAFDTARDAARELESCTARDAALRAACNTLEAARFAADRVYAGTIVNPSIRAAVLLMTAHLYRNREAVTAEATNQLPLGFRELLMPHRVGWGV